ncbi:hypothetical protein Csa_000546 [Cucumis sativus]|nr:hypothetical protein Csa_000546 [Cucumis sativus]
MMNLDSELWSAKRLKTKRSEFLFLKKKFLRGEEEEEEEEGKLMSNETRSYGNLI